jgi:hypothetical protein
VEKQIAYCGLDCAQCGAYQATLAGDAEAMEKVAAAWRVEYDHPGITAEMIPCEGCTSTLGTLGFHCAECDIRACGVERGVANCGLCADYPCERLAGFMQAVPGTRENLDAARGEAGIA